jgi:outer membrane protein OmpA-like peptidoglycan-associated protein
MTNTLLANPDYLLIIHGHANPTLPPGAPGFEAELADCRRVAQERADSVATEFARRGILWITDENDPNLKNNRIKTNGFGGNRTIGDPTHPELNRRVEVIIVNISTTEISNP